MSHKFLFLSHSILWLAETILNYGGHAAHIFFSRQMYCEFKPCVLVPNWSNEQTLHKPWNEKINILYIHPGEQLKYMYIYSLHIYKNILHCSCININFNFTFSHSVFIISFIDINLFICCQNVNHSGDFRAKSIWVFFSKRKMFG